MLSEFQNEGYRKHISEERKIYLENIFHASTTHAIDTMSANQSNFQNDLDDLSITHIVRRDGLRDSIVRNMNRVYDQMRSLYDDVKANSQTTDRVKVYEELMKQEQRHHESVNTIERKTNLVEKEIAQLKDELSVISTDNNATLTKMNNDKELVTNKFKKFFVEFQNNARKDEEILRFLVVESEKTLTVEYFNSVFLECWRFSTLFVA